MHNRNRPTLRDVARLSGLSVTQSSRALNGHSDVAEATRRKAEAAARQLGYVPNREARRLKMPDTRAHSIGLVLVPSQRFSDPFLGDLLTTMVDQAADCGYDLQLFAPRADDDPTASYEQVIRNKRVDGFVVLRTLRDDPRVRRLAQRSFPFVTFGHVDIDTAGGSGAAVVEAADSLQVAVEHLVALGHRRIGCLIEPQEFSVGAGRHRSFLAAMESCGLAVDQRHIIQSGFHDDTALAAVGPALDAPDRPTALVASNDLLALGAMRAAAMRGIDVPHELSIVGFDDISAAQYASPALTTLRHSNEVIGRQLVNQLVQAIEDPGAVEDVIIRPELIVRDSTAPPWPKTTA